MFSFIVIAKDNPAELILTIESIVNQVDVQMDEIILIDSSSSNAIKNYSQSLPYPYKSIIKYSHQFPKGVYSAQNTGIKLASKAFLCVVNSGDYLLPNSRTYFASCAYKDSNILIHVFAQKFSDENVNFKSTFYPAANTFWPHQSIIYSRCIHSLIGPYPEIYKFCADQVFFATARQLFPFKIYSFPTSHFNTNGISSGYSLRYMREIFKVYRLLGRNLFKAFMLAYVLPSVKSFMKPIIPNFILQVLQSFLSNHRGLL